LGRCMSKLAQAVCPGTSFGSFFDVGIWKSPRRACAGRENWKEYSNWPRHEPLVSRSSAPRAVLLPGSGAPSWLTLLLVPQVFCERMSPRARLSPLGAFMPSAWNQGGTVRKYSSFRRGTVSDLTVPSGCRWSGAAQPETIGNPSPLYGNSCWLARLPGPGPWPARRPHQAWIATVRTGVPPASKVSTTPRYSGRAPSPSDGRPRVRGCATHSPFDMLRVRATANIY
jgi:hypothetical protein